MTDNQSKSQLIGQFLKLISATPDSRHGVHDMVEFLSATLRYRNFIPPTAEFVTILKHQKPVLFQHLKQAISSTSILFFVIQLDMDYETALERLALQPEQLYASQTS